MTFLNQKFIIRAIWLLAFIDAMRQGLNLPNSELVSFMGTSGEFKIFPALFGLFAPPALVFLNLFIEKFFPRIVSLPLFSLAPITRWIEEQWGEGALRQFMQALQPSLLVIISALILGIVGLISSIKTNAKMPSFEIASFFLTAGLGFAIARGLGRRLSKNHFYYF
jgi:hypothetical protein